MDATPATTTVDVKKAMTKTKTYFALRPFAVHFRGPVGDALATADLMRAECHGRGDMTSLALASAIKDLDGQLSPHQQGSRVSVQQLSAGVLEASTSGVDEMQAVDAHVAAFYEREGYVATPPVTPRDAGWHSN